MSDARYEYAFDAPADGVPGLMYVTRNLLLAETLQSARPEASMYRRPVPEQDWEVVANGESGPRHEQRVEEAGHAFLDALNALTYDDRELAQAMAASMWRKLGNALGYGDE